MSLIDNRHNDTLQVHVLVIFNITGQLIIRHLHMLNNYHIVLLHNSLLVLRCSINHPLWSKNPLRSKNPLLCLQTLIIQHVYKDQNHACYSLQLLLVS